MENEIPFPSRTMVVATITDPETGETASFTGTISGNFEWIAAADVPADDSRAKLTMTFGSRKPGEEDRWGFGPAERFLRISDETGKGFGRTPDKRDIAAGRGGPVPESMNTFWRGPNSIWGGSADYVSVRADSPNVSVREATPEEIAANADSATPRIKFENIIFNLRENGEGELASKIDEVVSDLCWEARNEGATSERHAMDL